MPLELAFWLFLLHQGPGKRDWFHSWEFRAWYIGSIVAVLGMPLTVLVSRHHLDTTLAWIFLVGSAAGTFTTVCFLYVIFRFPKFLEYVKAGGAEADVIVRLATFYELNCIRVAFRFIFSLPLLIIALDAIRGPYPIVGNAFASDFLLMMAGIGSFISSGITLLIFFPRSITHESGYRIKVISPHSSTTPPSVVSPEYYHDHHQSYLPNSSNPISALENPASPSSTARMNSFRYPQDPHRLRHSDHTSPALIHRHEYAESADFSMSYESDAEIAARSQEIGFYVQFWCQVG
ncbi:hypothetical protein EST38_g254 [Candolleomyces aberdarensis]|uniref:Uncharacterized protein n=1 Tax=Candolleomyces aberdarensis TaxID=2316362 RepID=A0A4V1Q5H1_9AGAR|nr:hypothetical protein EST38_g254 [Candolleomyces aberdarensis]